MARLKLIVVKLMQWASQVHAELLRQTRMD